MNRKAVIWLAVVGVVAIGVGTGAGLALNKKAQAAAEAKKQKEKPPLEFAATDVVQLASRRLSVDLALPGSVMAVSQATVRSKLSAEIRRVPLREGERVTAGQVIVELDTAALKVQLAERQAALESARAQLSQTDRTRQVNAQLVKQNFISQNAFDTADSAHRAQVAAAEAAQAQVAQTQLLLNDAIVKAPISGQIAKRYVQPGEKVAFDTPLVSIVDLSQLEVQVQAPVSDIAQIVRGARVDVEIEGLPDKVFSGRVDRINPSTEPGTRTINFYVALANEQALLRAGMFARVRLQLGQEREVAALPVSAVRLENGQSIVWVIADGKLARRPVTVGRRDERAQMIEIVDGVTRGDQVIATKFDNLRDGLAARIISGSAPDARVADKDAPRAPGATN